jgi:hypothetical protein
VPQLWAADDVLNTVASYRDTVDPAETDADTRA